MFVPLLISVSSMIFLLVSVYVLFVTMNMAHRKGYPKSKGFKWAFFLGPIGLVVVARMQTTPERIAELEEEEDTPKKPGQWNIFMVMLAVSLLAICASSLTLAYYLDDRFGSPPWWDLKEAGSSETQSYDHERDQISLNRVLG